MSQSTIEQSILLAPNQKPAAAQMLTRAFQDDPLYARLIPNEPERLQCLNSLWEAIIHSCLLFGEVYTTPTLKGAACWTAPGQADMNVWQMLRSGFALPRVVMRYRPATRKRFLEVLAVMERVRHEVMQKNKYWYLWLLGVEPGYQGQGIGGMLLQPVLKKADAAGIPCYLETETERNVVFYRKHGFHVAREETVAWLDQKIWMLRREPHNHQSEN